MDDKVEETAAEQARRLALLLDEKKPGWASLIDLERFCMDSNLHCIMGQLHVADAKYEDEFVWESVKMAMSVRSYANKLVGIETAFLFYAQHSRLEEQLAAWKSEIAARKAA